MKEVDFEEKKGFGETETSGPVGMEAEEAFQAEGVRHAIYREGYRSPL